MFFLIYGVAIYLFIVQLNIAKDYPKYGEILEVDEMPKVDYKKLSQFIVYPNLALEKEIEGKVIVSVLIDDDGTVVSREILYTDSRIFNQPSLNAIDNYGKFIPAIKNGKNVPCWLNIPFNFKLEEKEQPVEFKIDYLSNSPLDIVNEKNEVVHKAPIVDMYKIEKNIVYPLLARHKYIQGDVVIKIYIDKNGYFKSFDILYTDSKLLNNAALEALKKYERAEYPSTKNGVHVACYLIVTLKFRLR